MEGCVDLYLQGPQTWCSQVAQFFGLYKARMYGKRLSRLSPAMYVVYLFDLRSDI